MVVATVAAFLLFWLRDYWLLQLGRPACIMRRFRIYAALVFTAAILAWLLARSQSPDQFFSTVGSARSLIALFAFHAVAAAACFWLRRTGRHHLAWLAAMIPAPAAWILLAETILLATRMNEIGRRSLVCGVAALWIAPMAFWLSRGEHSGMRLEDQDYVVNFAGWTNCFGAGLVVLAISPDAIDSFNAAIAGLSGK